MGNANIPDDWTNGYIDYVVKWPNSEQWEAILRGLLTSPAFDDFWDLFSGDPNPSMVAMWPTFDTNLHLQGGTVIPTGTIIDFAGSTIPNGWLICDFSEVDRVEYAALFSVIGTIYGSGDGETTFNLPPASGRVNVALDITDADFNTLGEFRGQKAVTLETTEIPSHTHLQNAHNHTQSPHLHAISMKFRTATVTANSSFPESGESSVSEGPAANTANETAVNIAQTATNQNTGGGNAHNNIQPSIVFYRLIKT